MIRDFLLFCGIGLCVTVLGGAFGAGLTFVILTIGN
jgi:hypothetical protein